MPKTTPEQIEYTEEKPKELYGSVKNSVICHEHSATPHFHSHHRANFFSFGRIGQPTDFQRVIDENLCPVYLDSKNKKPNLFNPHDRDSQSKSQESHQPPL